MELAPAPEVFAAPFHATSSLSSNFKRCVSHRINTRKLTKKAALIPLESTLVDLLVSVENKRLIEILTPLKSTLMKKGGRGQFIVN